MGEKEFDDYYFCLYGSRWEALKKALMEPSKSVPYSMNLKKPYMMDEASVLAASALPLSNADLILDACAAPGGKSLVLASLMPPKSQLLSNELSAERRRRLVNVLNDHLDSGIRNRVTVSGFDAASIARKKSEHGRFDAILLDAPCSSERHVLSSAKHLNAWTASRPRFLAVRQKALLSAAFLMLKKDGYLLYATCALSECENDGNADRLLKKYGTSVKCVLPDFCLSEKTRHGRIILPDTSGGAGPMYVAMFKSVYP